MRVLLTGAAGFVGRIALDLLKDRHEVTAFDIRALDNYSGVLIGDVLDYKELLKIVEGHDAIVNTIMAPNDSYGGNGLGFTVNVSGMYLVGGCSGMRNKAFCPYFKWGCAYRLSQSSINIST